MKCRPIRLLEFNGETPTFLPETETTTSHPGHKELQIQLLKTRVSETCTLSPAYT